MAGRAARNHRCAGETTRAPHGIATEQSESFYRAAVVQEQPMGCAVACVASLLGTSYTKALGLFADKTAAVSRGYYCAEICRALSQHGRDYAWRKAAPSDRARAGDIVFVSPSRRYPAGHFLLKTSRGWMNPWVNFPRITPAKAGFERGLPGRAAWVISPCT